MNLCQEYLNVVAAKSGEGGERYHRCGSFYVTNKECPCGVRVVDA